MGRLSEKRLIETDWLVKNLSVIAEGSPGVDLVKS